MAKKRAPLHRPRPSPRWTPSDELFLHHLLDLLHNLQGRDPTPQPLPHSIPNRPPKTKAPTSQVSVPKSRPPRAPVPKEKTVSTDKSETISPISMDNLENAEARAEIEEENQMMNEQMFIRRVHSLIDCSENESRKKQLQSWFQSCLLNFKKVQEMVENPKAIGNFRSKWPEELSRPGCSHLKIAYFIHEEEHPRKDDPTLIGRRFEKAQLIGSLERGAGEECGRTAGSFSGE